MKPASAARCDVMRWVSQWILLVLLLLSPPDVCQSAILQYEDSYYCCFPGTLLQTYAKVLFSSTKTLEVAVRVEQQRLYPGRGIYTARVADGLMTFMVVDTETGKTRPVPPVKVSTSGRKRLD